MLAARPGFRTSEFLVALVTFVGYLVNAAADYVSTTNATLYSLPALAYIISRGLAKYEARPTPTTPPAVPPPAA